MNYHVVKDFLTYKIKYGRGFEKELKQISELHNMSKNEVQEIKNKRFVEQYQNAFNHSKFYRELYQKNGLNLNSIQSLSDIKKIPIITKKEVRAHGSQILTHSRLTVFKAYSSGTTGSPLQMYRNYSSIVKEQAYGHFFQQMHGYQLGDPVVSLRGVLDSNTFSHLDRSNNVLYLSSFHLNSGRIEDYYQKIKEFQPKVIRAYPSSIHILATEFYKMGKELNVPVIFTSSEVLHDFQREIVEKVFNSKIYDWYGNAERTVALGQYKDSLYRELPLYSHIEAEDNYLITTSFINFAFPLIRYKVNDVIRLRPESNGTCVAEKIEGRDDDYIVLKNGQQIGRLDVAFKKTNRILAAQIIQDQIGEIQVRLVPDKSFSDSHLKEVENNLRKFIGNECLIRFEKIETNQLIRTKRGKFNLVVSQIKK